MLGNCLISLMAEETSVLGWMIFRQGRHTVWRVTLIAELFSFFFVHLHEFGMVFIVGEIFGRLLWGVPEKEEKTDADNYKKQVVEENVFSF